MLSYHKFVHDNKQVIEIVWMETFIIKYLINLCYIKVNVNNTDFLICSTTINIEANYIQIYVNKIIPY